MNAHDPTLPCIACDAPIPVGPDLWKLVGSVFACPACGKRNYLYPDEDADCNYWFAFEDAELHKEV